MSPREVDAPGEQGRLAALDMAKRLDKQTYAEELQRLQGQLNQLARRAREQSRPVVTVFEGWDASGKGGAIRRLAASLDVRDYRIVSVGPPTDEERARHYLWRFWHHVPPAGRWTIFDRSWYGRVLVERIEEFAARHEWMRAYDEINAFETQLVDHGTILAKFWIHITPDEQRRRFKLRKSKPHKRWKLTEEDWRNRARWSEYEQAVEDMVAWTDTTDSPWSLIEGDDKRYSRVAIMRTLADTLERALSAAHHQRPTISGPPSAAHRTHRR